ncbi:MAG TPA: SDR family oxidoreductase [Baekduia sp.]|uniref:SDR family oxidoreductase n=1 Tax=Baekduia sp. TaxID=2600305 RepID=UPI002D77279E|nr:SDR family oxidoreductase [Baekduia sp.]HET6508940.1 SDR family oxidoreductase [Baekduia sp.]
MAKQHRILTGQVAAITGAARGIGRATAQAFLREGMKVAIGDLDHATAQETAKELGHGTVAFELDVTRRESVKAFLDGVEEQLGPIDILVNNAGIMQVGHVIWEEDDATTQRMIDINVNGVMHGVKEVVPRFLARGRGHVVNVASTAGKGGFPGGGTYCGTKHYVVGLSEALRAELRGTGVEVSCVMPVVVNTELASGLTETRGVKTVQPEDVAAEIVSALQEARFDVFVPRSVAGITKVMNLLPRGGREGLSRALKADQVLMQIDEGKRAAYELRASQSDPALEAGDPTRQLTP